MNHKQNILYMFKGMKSACGTRITVSKQTIFDIITGKPANEIGTRWESSANYGTIICCGLCGIVVVFGAMSVNIGTTPNQWIIELRKKFYEISIQNFDIDENLEKDFDYHTTKPLLRLAVMSQTFWLPLWAHSKRWIPAGKNPKIFNISKAQLTGYSSFVIRASARPTRSFPVLMGFYERALVRSQRSAKWLRSSGGVWLLWTLEQLNNVETYPI